MSRRSFDQRKQTLDNQYNAGNDINLDHHYGDRIHRQYNLGGGDSSLSYAFAVGGCFTKAMMIGGMLIALAGFLVWMGVIFSAWASMPDSQGIGSYGLPVLTLIPWAPIGFVMFLLGGIVTGIGKTIAESRAFRR